MQVNNPRYLNKFSDDILKLINYLRKLGIIDLNLFLDNDLLKIPFCIVHVFFISSEYDLLRTTYREE